VIQEEHEPRTLKIRVLRTALDNVVMDMHSHIHALAGIYRSQYNTKIGQKDPHAALAS